MSRDAEIEAFYERHWKYVYRLCFTYLKNEKDAEDCTEDVFVKVITGNITFQDEVHERKWLTVSAMNLCKDRLKRFDRRHVVSMEDTAVPDLPAPEKEDQSALLDAVMRLPPKLKDVIWLYYYEGYATDEIAEMLGRPPSTVRNQMRDARKRLKSGLGGDLR